MSQFMDFLGPSPVGAAMSVATTVGGLIKGAVDARKARIEKKRVDEANRRTHFAQTNYNTQNSMYGLADNTLMAKNGIYLAKTGFSSLEGVPVEMEKGEIVVDENNVVQNIKTTKGHTEGGLLIPNLPKGYTVVPKNLQLRKYMPGDVLDNATMNTIKAKVPNQYNAPTVDGEDSPYKAKDGFTNIDDFRSYLAKKFQGQPNANNFINPILQHITSAYGNEFTPELSSKLQSLFTGDGNLESFKQKYFNALDLGDNKDSAWYGEFDSKTKSLLKDNPGYDILGINNPVRRYDNIPSISNNTNMVNAIGMPGISMPMTTPNQISLSDDYQPILNQHLSRLGNNLDATQLASNMSRIEADIDKSYLSTREKELMKQTLSAELSYRQSESDPNTIDYEPNTSVDNSQTVNNPNLVSFRQGGGQGGEGNFDPTTTPTYGYIQASNGLIGGHSRQLELDIEKMNRNTPNVNNLTPPPNIKKASLDFSGFETDETTSPSVGLDEILSVVPTVASLFAREPKLSIQKPILDSYRPLQYRDQSDSMRNTARQQVGIGSTALQRSGMSAGQMAANQSQMMAQSNQALGQINNQELARQFEINNANTQGFNQVAQMNTQSRLKTQEVNEQNLAGQWQFRHDRNQNIANNIGTLANSRIMAKQQARIDAKKAAYDRILMGQAAGLY